MAFSDYAILLLIGLLILFGFYVLWRILVVVVTVDYRLKSVERTVTSIHTQLRDTGYESVVSQEENK